MIGTEGVIAALHEHRDDQLAVAALLAVAAGDDLDLAIARMERVVTALPMASDFPARSRSRKLSGRVEAIAKSSLSALRQVAEANR